MPPKRPASPCPSMDSKKARTPGATSTPASTTVQPAHPSWRVCQEKTLDVAARTSRFLFRGFRTDSGGNTVLDTTDAMTPHAMVGPLALTLHKRGFRVPGAWRKDDTIVKPFGLPGAEETNTTMTVLRMMVQLDDLAREKAAREQALRGQAVKEQAAREEAKRRLGKRERSLARKREEAEMAKKVKHTEDLKKRARSLRPRRLSVAMYKLSKSMKNLEIHMNY